VVTGTHGPPRKPLAGQALAAVNSELIDAPQSCRILIPRPPSTAGCRRSIGGRDGWGGGRAAPGPASELGGIFPTTAERQKSRRGRAL